MTNGLVNHFQIHVVLYVMSMSCHMSLRYVCYSSKQPLVCSQLRTASMALFRLPAQICFLAYSDCVQIDFKKSLATKKSREITWSHIWRWFEITIWYLQMHPGCSVRSNQISKCFLHRNASHWRQIQSGRSALERLSRIHAAGGRRQHRVQQWTNTENTVCWHVSHASACFWRSHYHSSLWRSVMSGHTSPTLTFANNVVDTILKEKNHHISCVCPISVDSNWSNKFLCAWCCIEAEFSCSQSFWHHWES